MKNIWLKWFWKKKEVKTILYWSVIWVFIYEWIELTFSFNSFIIVQKQPPIGVFRKRYCKIMQQI